jgi:hypothetical protein
MLFEEYRETIIKSNEYLALMSSYRNKEIEAVYTRQDLIKSWNCLYNDIEKNYHNNIYKKSTVSKSKVVVYSPLKKIDFKKNLKDFENYYDKYYNAKKNNNKKKMVCTKTIRIENVDDDGFKLPHLAPPAVIITLNSDVDDDKPISEVIKTLKNVHKKPKKLSIMDLIKINLDKKRALEVKNMYFLPSSMSFVPASFFK